MLIEAGSIGEAESWLAVIAGRGDARGAARLADVHLDRGESAEAAAWLARAAHLANENLAQNKYSLLNAYGRSGVEPHVEIIRRYADQLAAQAATAESGEWRRRADAHLMAVSQA
jgi:hypothetical protein